MDNGLSDLQLGGATALIVLAMLVIAIILRPAVALVVVGVLAILAGLIAGGILGMSLGATGIVSGIVLIGLGRLIGFVEELLKETRAMRRAIDANVDQPPAPL